MNKQNKKFKASRFYKFLSNLYFGFNPSIGGQTFQLAYLLPREEYHEIFNLFCSKINKALDKEQDIRETEKLFFKENFKFFARLQNAYEAQNLENLKNLYVKIKNQLFNSNKEEEFNKLCNLGPAGFIKGISEQNFELLSLLSKCNININSNLPLIKILEKII